MVKQIVLLLTSILFLASCNSINENLEKMEFINDYAIIDQKCEEALLDILRSAEKENGNYKVSKLYDLDIKLNSKIYEKSKFTD